MPNETQGWTRDQMAARAALELKPEAPLLMIALAQATLASRDVEDIPKAEALLKAAITREPSNSYAWYLLADVYARGGNDALAKYATAERFYALGDVESARSFAQRAQEDLPRNEPQWRRASDIIVVADTQLATKKGRRGGRKPVASLTLR